MAEEAQPEGGGDSEAGDSKIVAWWRERVVTPLLDQLRRGVDAPSLARSTAMGVAVGLGPLPGLSSVIVGAIAVAGGHNMVAAQVAQLVMAPGNQQPPHAAHPCCSPALTSCAVALLRSAAGAVDPLDAERRVADRLDTDRPRGRHPLHGRRHRRLPGYLCPPSPKP